MGDVLTGSYTVTPDNIHISDNVGIPPIDGFDHILTNMAAARIVRHCQTRNEGWKPFTLQSLHDSWCQSGSRCYLRATDWHTFRFGRLIERRLIIPRSDDTFAITTEFVDICKQATGCSQ